MKLLLHVGAALLALPAFAGKPLPQPPEDEVVGLARAIAIAPPLAELQGPGGEVATWRYLHVERDAAFLKPHFVDVNLHPGDSLVVRGISGRVVEEITGRGPRDAGNFWGLSAFGDVLELELKTRHRYSQLPFRIDQVIVGDAAMFEPLDLGSAPESVCAPPDYEQVACYLGGADAAKDANIRASVGVMSVGTNPVTSGTWCSGSTLSSDGAVLTNQHCILNQGDCDTAEFVYRYWRTGCGSATPIATDWVSVRCDQVLAQSPLGDCDAGLSDLDFTLASVESSVGVDEFGWVEVDPNPLTSGEAIYILQHPDGRPKEIAHGSGADVVVDGTVLRYYDTLDTEGGSSGSPIFRDSDDLLVGLHHCGGCETPGTGNRGMLMSDIYPHIQTFLCTTEVEVSASASTPTEVNGDGDALLEPGETWSFVPSVRNRSCADTAEGVTANLAPSLGSASITILDTTASFGDIAPGASAAALSPVRFVVGATCGGTISIDLTDVAATNVVGPLGDYPAVATAPIGGMVWTTLASTDFSAGIPGDWTVVDGGTGTGPAATWTTANPGGRSLALTPPFAIADSDELGNGGFIMDEQLISPVIAVPAGADAIEVVFAHDFNFYETGGAEKADVDVRSTATSSSWLNVQRFDSGDTSGTVAVDVTGQASGQSDFQVRFYYRDANFDWWWAVDDVIVRSGTAECSPFQSLFADGFEAGDTSAWTSSVP